MATRTWLDVSGDLNSTGNYSAATLPVNGDTFDVQSGNKTVTTSTTQFASTDLANFYLRSGFVGAWGAVSTPIKFGAMTGELMIDAPLASIAAVWPASVPKLIVVDGNANPGGGVYVYDGTITDFIILGGGYIRIGGAVDGTNLWVLGGQGTHPTPQVYIEAGCSFTNGYFGAGLTKSYGTFTNIYAEDLGVSFGTLQILGDSTLSTTTLRSRGRSRVDVYAPGTHTAIEAIGGTVDFSKDMRSKTITNGKAMTGGTIIGHSAITASNALISRGGRIVNIASQTIEGMQGFQQG